MKVDIEVLESLARSKRSIVASLGVLESIYSGINSSGDIAGSDVVLINRHTEATKTHCDNLLKSLNNEQIRIDIIINPIEVNFNDDDPN